MRLVLLSAILICLCPSFVHAATYYFSSSGNDSYSASQAKSQSTPWKSINKLNAIWSTLQPGDVVLFKRGDTFYGTIKPTKSGTASAPITIGAYGSGNKPVITGFVTLSNWVSVGSGKYESYNASLGSAVNVVSFNGKNQEMGRYPNSNTTNGGYLKFESHGTNYIKDNELTSATNWTGAELVVRSSRYTIDRTKITSHSSTTLSYSTGLTYAPLNGFGYFIQNSVKTLDQLGEWYYNASTKKMTVYFGSSSPSAYPVRASCLGRLLDINGKSYITLDNLAFSGANEQAISVYNATNVQIKNSDISFSTDYAIYASGTQKFLAQSNTINHTQSTAISISGGSYAQVKNNKISNSGLLKGMGKNGTSKSVGILESGSNHVIEGNSIENTGYNGISFFGNYVLIKNNLVRNFNTTKDDGGGIYTVNPAGRVTTGQKVIGNIVLDGIGAAGGTNTTTSLYTKGIYMDDRSTNVEIGGNTVARNSNAGVFLHNSTNINLHDNLLFDNYYTQLLMAHDNFVADKPLRGLTIKNNILISKTPDQRMLLVKTLANDIPSMGTIDYNTYSCPTDKYGGYLIETRTNAATSTVTKVHDLKSWQNVYKKDLNGRASTAFVQLHKLNALIGSNRFSNGSFNSNITGLNASASASYSKSWVASKLDAGTFQGTLSSSTPSLYTTYTPIGAVTAGKKYVVKFTAQSSRDTSMKVYFRKSASPYTVLSNEGTKNLVKITTSRKEYEFVFVPTASESNTVLFMEANARSQSFWLDNIKIYEADATLINPDDYIRLVYNASASSQTVSLGSNYVDALGKSYNGSITLAPYTSAVLIKTSTTTSTAATAPVANQAPTVSLTSPTANASFTAPASVRLTATASDADGSISKVEFYRGTTLITTEVTAPYDWTWSNVAAGTYTITAKAYDNSGKVTTSAPVTITVKAASLAMAMPTDNSMPMSTEATLHLYPNPATSSIYVDLGGVTTNQPAKLTIYNMAGSTVKSIPVTLSGNQIKVDISTLSPGAYLLSVAGEGFNKTQKFQKVD